jgi:hypothetical protein
MILIYKRKKLILAPLLSLSNFIKKTFEIECDVSMIDIRVILMQEKRYITYFRKKFNVQHLIIILIIRIFTLW